MGAPYISGYKPRWNYQNLLEERVVEYLEGRKNIVEPKFAFFSDSVIEQPLKEPDFNKIIEAPPEKTYVAAEPKVGYQRRPIKINYLEREQRNSTLGEQGELFVIQYEKWRLNNIGKDGWSEKVEWISKNDDGAGFDILSKNENGTDRYIEVKTTKLSKDSPIFFTKTEYDFSKEKTKDYFLYRVFNFSKDPKIFNVNGDFDSFCSKQPTQFKGYF